MPRESMQARIIRYFKLLQRTIAMTSTHILRTDRHGRILPNNNLLHQPVCADYHLLITFPSTEYHDTLSQTITTDAAESLIFLQLF